MTSLAAITAADSPPTLDLGEVGDFSVPSLRLVHAGGRRLLVVTTESGFHVTDNACPHEGYGLVQGDVREGVLTCAWHNWKYRLADGRCLRGQEDLVVYPARTVDGRLVVDVPRPDLGAERVRLLDSLRRGLDDGYVGQMARDVVRLLRADADPVQLAWEAVSWGAPRAKFGFGHAMASLVDCLAVARTCAGDARALPIVAAFAGVADVERRRPLRPHPEPVTDLPARPAEAFRAALEGEDLWDAEALLRGALVAGAGPEEMRRWLIGAVSDHHLGYGHAAIYVQKAFALLEQLGWDRAPHVLPHLVPAIGYSTREDRLPYMRAYARAALGVDTAAVARCERSAEGVDPEATEALRAALLGRDAAAVVPAAVAAAERGGGVDGILDIVVDVAAHRLARYDPTAEVTSDAVDFSWLDITHALTYAAAGRWAWESEPGPDAARLALWCAFLACYAGRRGYVEVPADAADPVDPSDVPPDAPGLCRSALEDRAGAPIVAFHLVKTTGAAVAEAARRPGTGLIEAAGRFVASPRRESFVALNVRKAVQLADGRVPD